MRPAQTQGPYFVDELDVWQCDHLGVYSDVEDPSFSTVGKKFLRGYQVTDDKGRANFTTIYPGWYRGRTVHIHFKLRSPATQLLLALAPKGQGYAGTFEVALQG